MKVRELRNVLVSQRRVTGWSQEELAERSGVSVRTIRNLETGVNRNPRRTSVELILAAFSSATLAGGVGLAPESRAPVPVVEVVEASPAFFPGARSPWYGIRPRTDSTIGRRTDLRQVVTAAQRGRLTVLTGPAGIGKTRLALAAAERVGCRARRGSARGQ
jgi:transcriptional regulator with XRE-family HTH domain